VVFGGVEMSKVAIVTDSNHCLGDDFIREYDIRVVPIDIIFEDKVYRDIVDMDCREFYSRLRAAKKLPTTATPPAGRFFDTFPELSKETDSIVCIMTSSGLSATIESAREAVERAKQSLPQLKVEVIDTYTVAGAQGLVVLEAARAAASGQSIAQITKRAKSVIKKVNLLITVNTLHYLIKGGRIGLASGWAGTLLNVKPILECSTSVGMLQGLERPRTRQRAVERLLGIMKERVGEAPVHVIVNHADVPDEGEELRKRVSSMFNCAELYLTEWTPVIGVHTGPGMLGLSFYAED
jgi:DegV family protein with EDD domain